MKFVSVVVTYIFYTRIFFLIGVSRWRKHIVCQTMFIDLHLFHNSLFNFIGVQVELVLIIKLDYKFHLKKKKN